jgi:hypothetical protein
MAIGLLLADARAMRVHWRRQLDHAELQSNEERQIVCRYFIAELDGLLALALSLTPDVAFRSA